VPLPEGGYAETEVPIESLTIGDEVVIHEQVVLPVDGVVVDGEGIVDQAAITAGSCPSRPEWARCYRRARCELPPRARTPDLRWPPATRKDAVVPPPHPAEFRHRAVELARQRSKPIADLAKELRISESCLRNWVAQAEVDEKGSATELTSAEKKELAQLRKDKRRLELEVEILKRAAAYFARENVLPN
jgi:fatty-acyl-CoA synthase